MRVVIALAIAFHADGGRFSAPVREDLEISCREDCVAQLRVGADGGAIAGDAPVVGVFETRLPRASVEKLAAELERGARAIGRPGSRPRHAVVRAFKVQRGGRRQVVAAWVEHPGHGPPPGRARAIAAVARAWGELRAAARKNPVRAAQLKCEGGDAPRLELSCALTNVGAQALRIAPFAIRDLTVLVPARGVALSPAGLSLAPERPAAKALPPGEALRFRVFNNASHPRGSRIVVLSLTQSKGGDPGALDAVLFSNEAR